MPRCRVLARGAAADTLTARVRNQADTQARRATNVHPGAAHLVPEAYVRGAPGWTVPIAVLLEPEGGTRVAVVAENDFAVGRPDFDAATDSLPGDWLGGGGIQRVEKKDADVVVIEGSRK